MGICNIKYTRPNTLYQKRLLCNAGTEQDTEPTKVTWQGVALDYNDKFTRSKTIYGTATHPDTNNDKKNYRCWFNAYGSCNLSLCYITKINPGYYPSLEQKCADGDEDADKDIWNAKIYNYNSGSTYYTYYLRQDETFALSCDATINLNTISNKTKEYEHIILWEDISNLRLSDPSWNHHLTNNPWYKRQDYSGNLTNIGQWAGTETNGYYMTNKDTTNFSNYYLGAYGSNSDSNPAITLGLLNTSYNATNINQTSETKTVKINGVSYTTDNSNLINGLLCFAANKDDIVTWSPVFTNTTKNGSSVNYELNVELSTRKFENGNTVPSTNVIKCDGQTNDYKTTVNGTCEFTFTMPTNGFVYCKWWPAESSGVSTSDKWSADLDLTACDSYHRKFQIK